MAFNLLGLQLGPTLVLQKFDFDEAKGTVDIQGRAPGLFAFIFAAMGLDATTTFTADPKMIAGRKSSLAGEDNTTIPTSCVATLSCGFNKPIGLLVFAALALFWGIFMALKGGGGGAYGMLGIVVAIALIVAYFLSKKMYIYVITNGGNMVGIKFKSSIIENVSVDIEKVKKVIAVVRNNILQSHGAVGPQVRPPI